MYKINMTSKSAEKIEETTFSKMGLKERNDIQEWIANTPGVLEYASELLIIQKEFDGFDDTDRRLDLLALDQQGNLVIIENKRDDTGKDVVWQAINYASFCSTLTASDVIEIYQKYLNSNHIQKDAEQAIADFFDGKSVIYPSNVQKIILVAREFRREVLSAAQWLSTNGIDITCIKFTPYEFNKELLLEVDRIFPQEELKDYTIKLSRKAADAKNQAITQAKSVERNISFWRALGERLDRDGTIFENIHSWDNNTNSWIGASAKMGHGLSFNFVITDDSYRTELYIDNKDAGYNKRVFDALYQAGISSDLSAPYTLYWERLDDRRASRIYIGDNKYQPKVSDHWNEIMDFLIPAMDKMVEIFKAKESLIKSIK